MNIWDEGKRRPKGRFLSASEGFLVIPRLFPSFSAASREEDSSMDPTTTKTLHSSYVYLFLSHVLNSSSWQKLPEAFSSLSLTIDICPVLTSNEEKSSWSPHRDETTSIESFWPRFANRGPISDIASVDILAARWRCWYCLLSFIVVTQHCTHCWDCLYFVLRLKLNFQRLEFFVILNRGLRSEKHFQSCFLKSELRCRRRLCRCHATASVINNRPLEEPFFTTFWGGLWRITRGIPSILAPQISDKRRWRARKKSYYSTR